MSADAEGPAFLGLDVGTQGTKGVVLDADSGEVVARAACQYGLLEGLPDGAAEQHPDLWIGAVSSVCKELLESRGVNARRIAGVGVSGQQHGLVALDKHDEVVRPAKLWCDTSTAAEAEELSASFGRAVPAGYTASKILWLARHEPENWAATQRVLLPHDYVNLRLTGRARMEAGDASGTGFFDPVKRAFDARLAKKIDARLPKMLPKLLAPGEAAGTLSGEGSAITRLPEGLPVSAGGGDNMMSALGAGATRPGVVVASLGSSGTVFSYADHAVIDPEGLIAPFCDSTGGWLPLLCVMNLTGVTEEVVALCAEATGNSTFSRDTLTELAKAVPPGCDGLMWLPYLQGERVPDLPRATGTLLGMRPGSLRPGTLFRAALEGTSLNLAWGVARLAALGIEVESLRLVGGGANNPLWRQILADILQVPVTALVETESAALGAAISASWTARRLAGEDVAADQVAAPCVALSKNMSKPDAARGAVYAELLARFKGEVARLHPTS
jgi:xylulokinase